MSRKMICDVKPSLLEEWDLENEIKPDSVTAGSNKRVLWKGSCGHRWEATVKNRVNGSGCPYCSPYRLHPGFNDLASQEPELAQEWSDKNLPLLPEMVGKRSSRKVWWKGACGHEWEARIADRTAGSGCPFCSGRILSGVNDLATTKSMLAREWADRNRGSPDEYSERSRASVWWKCHVCGCEWQMEIVTRTRGGMCPACRKADSLKRYEQYLECRIQERMFRKVKMQLMIEQWLYRNQVLLMRGGENIIGLPLSVYLPEYLMAIECSEICWKRKRWRVRETVKNDLCLKSKIRVIRILEPGIEPFHNCKCICRLDNSEEAYQAVIEQLAIIIGLEE